ncbi:MAG TPA: hypothetical protein VGD14_20665, partial [bacterium]
MKRIVIVFLILLWATQLHANFVARHLTQPDFSWGTFELKQLSFQIDVQGLFYQTIIEYEIRLVPT